MIEAFLLYCSIVVGESDTIFMASFITDSVRKSGASVGTAMTEVKGSNCYDSGGRINTSNTFVDADASRMNCLMLTEYRNKKPVWVSPLRWQALVKPRCYRLPEYVTYELRALRSESK